jgi:hypothetical protein
MFNLTGRAPTHELVAECESFLSGDLAERLLADGAVVPVWMWMNLLAHGTVDDLADPPRAIPGLPLSLEPWVQARAYLAGEILGVVESGTPILTLQREVLIPIERELARGATPRDFCPADWVGDVLAAMDRRAAQRRARGWT